MDHDTLLMPPSALTLYPVPPSCAPVLSPFSNIPPDDILTPQGSVTLLFSILPHITSQVSRVLDLIACPQTQQWWDGSRDIWSWAGVTPHHLGGEVIGPGTNPNINYHFYSILPPWCMISRQGTTFLTTLAGKPSLDQVDTLSPISTDSSPSSTLKYHWYRQGVTSGGVLSLNCDEAISDNKESDK